MSGQLLLGGLYGVCSAARFCECCPELLVSVREASAIRSDMTAAASSSGIERLSTLRSQAIRVCSRCIAAVCFGIDP